MKILVDTNVIIDVLTSREPWYKNAEKIFLMAANHTVDIYITASSATDIYYLVRKHLHSTETAKQIMGKMRIVIINAIRNLFILTVLLLYLILN